jgi:hypothetical protein
MPRPHTVNLSLLAVAIVMLAALATGCGSSGDSGSETSAGPGAGPTATATTPAAPPGASSRACESPVVGTEQLRVTGIGCDPGRRVAAEWVDKPACSSPADASRFSCIVDDRYRCLGAATGRGIAVSCAHPGSSVAFVAKRG